MGSEEEAIPALASKNYKISLFSLFLFNIQ